MSLIKAPWLWIWLWYTSVQTQPTCTHTSNKQTNKQTNQQFINNKTANRENTSVLEERHLRPIINLAHFFLHNEDLLVTRSGWVLQPSHALGWPSGPRTHLSITYWSRQTGPTGVSQKHVVWSLLLNPSRKATWKHEK